MAEDEWREPPDERDRPMSDHLVTAYTDLNEFWLQDARKSTFASTPGLADSPFARLEQIAIQLPRVALLAPLSAADDAFKSFLMQLPCNLPRLQVLRLCNLPTAEPELRRSYGECRWENSKDEKLQPVKARYLEALDVFATHVTSHISAARQLAKLPALRVLCFGELSGHWDIDPQPRYYDELENYRAKPRFAACHQPLECKKSDGGMEVVAKRVRIRDIFYDDRHYDILSGLMDMD
ncbi:hypothetical protein LTR95_004841 [Oleoguttula sp. CCFEE 5521]